MQHLLKYLVVLARSSEATATRLLPLAQAPPAPLFAAYTGHVVALRLVENGDRTFAKWTLLALLQETLC